MIFIWFWMLNFLYGMQSFLKIFPQPLIRAVYPEADLGICVLLNNNSKLAKTVIPDLYRIVQAIYDQTTAKLAVNKSPDNITHL